MVSIYNDVLVFNCYITSTKCTSSGRLGGYYTAYRPVHREKLPGAQFCVPRRMHKINAQLRTPRISCKNKTQSLFEEIKFSCKIKGSMVT